MHTTEPRSLSEHKTTCTKPSLGSNFGRAENLDHPLILVFRQSSQTHCRSYPDITLKSDARHARHHAQLWESCFDVRYWCPAWSKSCLDIKNKTYEDLQVHIHRKITQTHSIVIVIKIANDHVISLKRMLLQQQTVDSIQQTNLQVLLWTKQTPHSEILKDDFKSTLNQAIHKWPLWTFFSKFYLKNMSSLFHIFCHMD